MERKRVPIVLPTRQGRVCRFSVKRKKCHMVLVQRVGRVFVVLCPVKSKLTYSDTNKVFEAREEIKRCFYQYHTPMAQGEFELSHHES